MKTPENGVVMRIFLGESDTWQGTNLSEAIVLKARKLGINGATVLHGIMGYGAHSLIHTSKILRLSEDLPVVIVIADTKDHVELLMPFLEETVMEGLVTIENAEIYRFTEGNKSQLK